MTKAYVAAGALVIGLLAVPAVASAHGSATQPAATPVESSGAFGSWDDMHGWMFGADGGRFDYEGMEQMHDSMWGPDGIQPGYEWMEQMHDSMWGPDGADYGSMMGSGYDPGAGYGSMMGSGYDPGAGYGSTMGSGYGPAGYGASDHCGGR